MSIHTALGMEGHEFCHPIDQSDFETITRLINGQPRKASWQPIAMQLIRRDLGRPLQQSDSPWLGDDALIFRQSAIAVLGPILREYGELLPLDCPGAEVHMFNPTRVLDALDEQASSLLRFRDGDIADITRHAFRPEVIDGADIFKLSNLRVSSTYVSDRIVDLWNSSGLRGLEFPQVWPAE